MYPFYFLGKVYKVDFKKKRNINIVDFQITMPKEKKNKGGNLFY